MSDIVERLRQEVNTFYGKPPCGIINEAADEIEKLRKAIKLGLFELDDAAIKITRAEILLKAAIGEIK